MNDVSRPATVVVGVSLGPEADAAAVAAAVDSALAAAGRGPADVAVVATTAAAGRDARLGALGWPVCAFGPDVLAEAGVDATRPAGWAEAEAAARTAAGWGGRLLDAEAGAGPGPVPGDAPVRVVLAERRWDPPA